MNFVEPLDTNIDYKKLQSELFSLINDHSLHNQNQISLTSVLGNNDWNCSTGRITELNFKEFYYKKINEALRNTYIESCINRYPEYYRWRALIMPQKYSYSIHSDTISADLKNYRIHIPVVTNSDSYMMFFDEYPKNMQYNSVFFAHFELGYAYNVDTTGLHSAVNFGNNTRIHLVGIKYENCNNWSH